jgi:hypothetical protein
VIADGPASELLAGGWYFATETARILGGAGGALLPEQGAELLASHTAAIVASRPDIPSAIPRDPDPRAIDPRAIAPRAIAPRAADAGAIVPGLTR